MSAEELGADVRRRCSRGTLILSLLQTGRTLVQLVSVVVLARWLGPEPFGQFAIAMAVIGLFQVLVSSGLATASIQAKELSTEQANALFWLNLAFSSLALVAIAILAAASPWWGWSSSIKRLLYVCGMGMWIESLSRQHVAALTRSFRFRTLAVVRMASSVATAAAGILYLWIDDSAMSMAIGVLAGGSTTTIGSCIAHRWIPGRGCWDDQTRKMLGFGANVTGTAVLTFLRQNADNLIVGTLCGMSVLGLYTRAYSLLNMQWRQIRMPLSAALLPTLSKLQDEPEEFRKTFFASLRMLTLVGFFLSGALFLTAQTQVRVLLGRSWDEVVPIYRCLLPLAMLRYVDAVHYWVSEPLGRPGRRLRWEAIQTPMVLMTVVATAPHGILAVALGVSLVHLLTWYWGIAFVLKETLVSARQVFSEVFPFAAVSIIAIGSGWLVGVEPHVVSYLTDTKIAGDWGEAVALIAYLSVWGSAVVAVPAVHGPMHRVRGWVSAKLPSRRRSGYLFNQPA